MTIKVVWSGSLLALLLSVIFLLPFLPIDVQRNVSASFLSANGSDKAVIFFGFTQCADTCPATLSVLRALVANNNKHKSQPQVAFVDINSNSSELQAQQYAQQFHASFIGVHPKPDQLAQLTSDFGLNFQQVNEQIQHKGRTYLLNRVNQQWRLVKVFNPDTFDAELLLQELY